MLTLYDALLILLGAGPPLFWAFLVFASSGFSLEKALQMAPQISPSLAVTTVSAALWPGYRSRLRKRIQNSYSQALRPFYESLYVDELPSLGSTPASARQGGNALSVLLANGDSTIGNIGSLLQSKEDCQSYFESLHQRRQEASWISLERSLRLLKYNKSLYSRSIWRTASRLPDRLKAYDLALCNFSRQTAKLASERSVPSEPLEPVVRYVLSLLGLGSRPQLDEHRETADHIAKLARNENEPLNKLLNELLNAKDSAERRMRELKPEILDYAGRLGL